MQPNEAQDDTKSNEAVEPSLKQPAEFAVGAPDVSIVEPPVVETSAPFGDPIDAAKTPASTTPVVQSDNSMAPTGPPPKKNIFVEKKRLIVGLGVAIIVLASVASFALSYFTLSKSDYKAAYTAQNDLVEDYRSATGLTSSLSTAMSKGGSTELVSSMNDKFTLLKANMKKLGETRAIRVDPELKAAYKAIEDKMPLFDEAYMISIESLEKVYPAYYAYSQTSLAEGTYESSINASIAAFGSAEDLKYAVNKTFMQSAKAAFEEALPYGKKIDAYKADYRKYEAGVSASYSAAIKKYTDALREWQNQTGEVKQKGDIKKEVNALSDLVYKKVNQ